MTNFCLAYPVDTTKSLLDLVRVPRQIIIDHQMATLEVYTFARCVIGVAGPADSDGKLHRERARSVIQYLRDKHRFPSGKFLVVPNHLRDKKMHVYVMRP